MVNREGPVWTMFGMLKGGVYSREYCNNGHDFEHIERMLAMRQALWPAITADEPVVDESAMPLDLAILFHDLNRSKVLRGREYEQKREEYALGMMSEYDVDPSVAQQAIQIIKGTFAKDSPDEPASVRLLRDLDKSDMGAIGVYRMAAVASDRKYGVFARREDFDLNATAIEGDENLDSFAADIKFCMDWWTNPKFAIRTPAIRKAVQHRFNFMSLYLAQLQTEMEEIGLIPRV